MNEQPFAYRRPELRQVDARLYFEGADRPPMFVLVEGSIYRRDEDQDDARLFLACEEVKAQIVALCGPAVLPLLTQLSDAATALDTYEQDAIMDQLVTWLPAHASVIRYFFNPHGETDPGPAELSRHAHCTLPPK